MHLACRTQDMTRYQRVARHGQDIVDYLRRMSCSKYPVQKTTLGGAGSHKQDQYIELSISSFSKKDKGDKSFVLFSRTSCQCQISDIENEKFFTKCSSS